MFFFTLLSYPFKWHPQQREQYVGNNTSSIKQLFCLLRSGPSVSRTLRSFIWNLPRNPAQNVPKPDATAFWWKEWPLSDVFSPLGQPQVLPSSTKYFNSIPTWPPTQDLPISNSFTKISKKIQSLQSCHHYPEILGKYGRSASYNWTHQRDELHLHVEQSLPVGSTYCLKCLGRDRCHGIPGNRGFTEIRNDSRCRNLLSGKKISLCSFCVGYLFQFSPVLLTQTKASEFV